MNPGDDNETIDLKIAEVIAHWLETPVEQRPTANELVDQHLALDPGLAECMRGLERLELSKTLHSTARTMHDEYETEEQAYPMIPDFDVICELGRGGMGVVYEAKQRSLDRIVALKVLPVGAVDSRAVKRFLREAETVAALSHPGIVPIYAVGVHNGLNWFAMQRIDGCPLSQWFAVSTFTTRSAAIDEVVRVGIEAAEALEHAHQRGVIHRDVKPGNLLVDTSGKVWLTDFGLARRDVDVTATATGAMLGTPRYMSAEQISSSQDGIDARTDIYSLGATMYEMATSRPPFTSESPLELLTQIRNDEPTPPRQLDANIPRSLELVILKCLDKDKDRRYHCAAALSADLNAIREDKPISAKGLPIWITASRFLKRNKRQINAVAMTVIVTAATLIAAALLWQQSEQAKLGRIRINTPGGLYVASIQSRNLAIRGKVTEPILTTHATTPMQQPVSLAAGEYLVRMAGTDQPSQLVEVNVKPRDVTEIEYIERCDSLPQVDIFQKLSVQMPDNTLAVLSKDAFEVFDPKNKPMLRFSLPTSELDVGLEHEAAESKTGFSPNDDPPLTFAFDSNQPFQGDYSVVKSAFARLERIATSPIDLDSDSQNDFLIAAAQHAAIAAVSHNGTVLWKQRLPMNFESPLPRSGNPKNGLPNEAIVGITSVDDLNQDGTADLVVNAALLDPAGFSRPHIFTLSGRDGSELSVVKFPTIAMQTVSNWPWSGLLRHQRGFFSAARQHKPIFTHFESISMRSHINILHCSSWTGNSGDSALYVLPPLILGNHKDTRVAITTTDRTVHFVNLADGSAAGPEMKLAEPILRGPLRVQLADGNLGVLVLTGIPATGYTKCFLELCVLGESKPRWTIPHDLSAYDLVACAADSSFPMLVDLDGDGNDEILCPTNSDIPFKWPQLRCYSVVGKPNWTTSGLAGISPVIDQTLPIGDVDSDGTIDLAVVGLIQNTVDKSSTEDGQRVTIDFLSGTTGSRLGYREEHISTSLKHEEIAEIDFVELVGHELVCSVVYGSQEELNLSSISIKFDLTQLAPASTARGLTVLGMSAQSSAATQGRWYRRRSGPYANPGDAAVWIGKEKKQASYPGESLVASWVSSAKEPRVMLSSGNGAVRCINPFDGRVLWKAERFYYNSNHVLVLERADGNVDLVCDSAGTRDVNAAFYDGETGRLQFKIASPKMDAIRYAWLDQLEPERFVYALAAADRSNVFANRNQGFLMLKIDRVAGSLVWSKKCYEGVDSLRPFRPADPIQVDLNQDKVTDLITGNTKNGRITLEAIDGNNGRVLWETPLNLDLDWPWREPWPMMTKIATGDQTYLLLIDGVAKENKLYDLKSIRLLDGRELSAMRRRASLSVRDDVQTGNLSLKAMSTTNRDGNFLLATTFPNDNSLDKGFGMKVLHVNEISGAFEEIKSDAPDSAISNTGPSTNLPDSVFLADIDGDQSLERIEYYAPTSIKIRRVDSDKWISEFEIQPSSFQLQVEKNLDKWYLVAMKDKKVHLWHELPSGRVAVQFGQGLQSLSLGEARYPRLLNHSLGTLLVGSTPEAVMCVEVDLAGRSAVVAERDSISVAMIAPESDSRYWKRISSYGIYERKSFTDVIRLVLLTSGAILLPIGFVYRLIRRRQWSLQSLLLAPAVTMLALVCWRALLASQSYYLIPDLFAGVMATLTIWAIFTLLRHQQWKLLGISLGLSMLLATIMMFGVQSSIANRTPGIVGYWTISAWLAAVCSIAFQLVLPLALPIAWTIDKANLRRKPI